MHDKAVSFILIVSAFLLGSAGAFGAQFPRLAAAAFRALPISVAADLERRGCVVPQTYTCTTPHNVVSGYLKGTKPKDWAVLCSDGQNSAVLVYWGGSTDNVSTLRSMPDKTFVQNIGNGEEGYSRRIRVVPPDRVKKKHPLAQVSHDGLEIAFVEKGSTIHYFDEGRRSRLLGAD